MANYQQWVEYFEQLSIQNNLIQHNLEGNKKFYTMDLEELFSAVTHKLPAPDAGPFFVFINYTKEIDHKGTPVDKKKMGFAILQGFKHGDYDGERLARYNSEEATDQYLIRMSHDSKNGVQLFQHRFDRINARTVPHSIEANITYAGWWTAFEPIAQFNNCFDENNWTLP